MESMPIMIEYILVELKLIVIASWILFNKQGLQGDV